MTSGTFTLLTPEQIIIDRDNRQRKELKDIDKLAKSIEEVGLINPVLITREHVLVAGERRLTAIKQLGWTHVPVQYADEVDDATMHLIELEENIKRTDLDWKDHCNAIDQYHAMRKAEDKDWNLTKTAEAIGIHNKTVSSNLIVAKGLREGDPLICKADKFSVAANIAWRKKSREDEVFNEELEKKIQEVQSPIGAAPKPESAGGNSSGGDDEGTSLRDRVAKATQRDTSPEAADANDLIHCIDFTSWAQDYRGKPFNFLHCDFPYGVDAGKHDQGAADKFGGYEDSFELYESLIDTLAEHQTRIMADSAHVIFWFSMDYYNYTLTRLTNDVNLHVNPFPLIWFKSDNSGILPDSSRGPRRNYETAFLCSRGDRKIVQAVSNCFPAPNKKTIHMSEKNPDMLGHFFRMTVDRTTRLLDPTAGSGNALKVARKMGAASVFGLEVNEEYHAEAIRNLMKEDEE